MPRPSTLFAYAVVLAAPALLLPVPASAQFELADQGEGLVYAHVAFGDYNADGKLDLAATGRTSNPFGVRVSRVYQNSQNLLALLPGALTGAYDGSVSWGDRDNDGILDPMFTGVGTSGAVVTRLYEGPSFIDVAGPFNGKTVRSTAWGDYDNDGDLDLLVVALYNTDVSRLYRNDGGTFTEVMSFPGSNGEAAWADYDGDGDLDLVIASDSTTVLRNSGGANPAFTDIGAGLLGVAASSVGWGDYDNDGDLDLLFTGTNLSPITLLYANSGGANPTFTQMAHGMLSVTTGAARWGDYDNDGLLDAVVVGMSQSNLPAGRVYRNLGGSPPAFMYVPSAVPGIQEGDAAWGDWDADGDLDIAVAGLYANYEMTLMRIYRNTAAATPNAPPAAPAGLTAMPTTVDGAPAIRFSWNPSVDDLTPTQSLTYNLRVGTTPGGVEVMSPLAIVSTGRRLVPALGNTSMGTSWTLRLPPGSYYWSVQAIDGGYAGSAFAPEQVVNLTVGADAVAPPAAFALRTAAPNPFRGGTSMAYDVPRSAPVRIEVFDLAGRRVRTLVDATVGAGRATATWDGSDAGGRPAPAGVYRFRMQSGAFTAERSAVLIR